jgi:CRISPR/Cas system CSM-associated protein Csm2 small subunit
VVVMAFEGGRMIKNYVTDEKGEFSFYVDRTTFDVLFYRPGMHSHACSVVNKMEKDIQGINLNVQMNDSTAETKVDLAQWLKRHHLTATYLDSVYAEAIEKLPPPKSKKKTKKQEEEAARAEQKRFSNFRQSTTRDSSDRSSEVTTTVIGPDTYEMITSQSGTRQYLKNNKPVTETTYKFETTRRYEGVLKSSRNVKKLDKYKPMQHVKGKSDG